MSKHIRNPVLALLAGLAAGPALSCGLKTGETLLTPASQITVLDSGFDASDRASRLYATFENGDETVTTYAVADGEGGFVLTVPMFLSNSFTDGPGLTLTVHGDGSGCSVAGLTRAALPRADGAMLYYLLSQIEVASLMAEMSGVAAFEIDRALQEKSDRENPGPLADISLAVELLAEWEQLTLQAADNAELAHLLSVSESYIVSSFLAQRSFDRFDALQDAREELFDTPWPNTPLRRSDLFGNPPGPERVIRTKATTSSGQPGRALVTVSAESLGLTTRWNSAQKLSAAMTAQRESQIANQPDIAILRDTAGTLFGISAGAANAASYGLVSAFFGGHAQFVFMQTMRDKVQEKLFPDKINGYEIDGGPYTLSTDGPGSTGQITDIRVKASAQGLNLLALTADIIVNFMSLDRAAKLAKPLASSGRFAREGSRVASSARAFETAMSRPGMQTLASIIEGFGKQVIGKITGHKDFPASGVVPRFEIAPVSIFEPGWYIAELDDHRAVNWQPGQPTTYSGREPGGAVLRVQHKPGAFGRSRVFVTQQITVADPQLIVTPDALIMAPSGHGLFEGVIRWAGDQGAHHAPVYTELSSGFALEPNIPARSGLLDGAPTNWEQFRINAPDTMQDFPGIAEFTTFLGSQRAQRRRITLPRITPDIPCIPEGHTVDFDALNHEGLQTPLTSWETDGPVGISSEGQLTAPPGQQSQVKVLLVSDVSGEVLDEMTVDLGCSCHWSVRMSGQDYQGEAISVTEVLGQLVVLGVDNPDLAMSLSGQGTLAAPSDIDVSLQLGEETWVSGSPVASLNILNECPAASLDVRQWSELGKGWLYADLAGTVMNVQGLSNGCAELNPVAISFLIDTGASQLNAITTEVVDDLASADGTESADLLATIAESGLSVSACLPKE